MTHVDHLTYVCRPGQSPAVLRWYEACLGARRFSASIADDPIEGEPERVRQTWLTGVCIGFFGAGLVIGDGIGMRLRVLDYWRCAETGLVLDDADANDGSSLKIVLVESLPHQGLALYRPCCFLSFLYPLSSHMPCIESYALYRVICPLSSHMPSIESYALYRVICPLSSHVPSIEESYALLLALHIKTSLIQ